MVVPCKMLRDIQHSCGHTEGHFIEAWAGDYATIATYKANPCYDCLLEQVIEARLIDRLSSTRKKRKK